MFHCLCKLLFFTLVLSKNVFFASRLDFLDSTVVAACTIEAYLDLIFDKRSQLSGKAINSAATTM